MTKKNRFRKDKARIPLPIRLLLALLVLTAIIVIAVDRNSLPALIGEHPATGKIYETRDKLLGKAPAAIATPKAAVTGGHGYEAKARSDMDRLIAAEEE